MTGTVCHVSTWQPLSWNFVLVRVSIALRNTTTKSNLGKEEGNLSILKLIVHQQWKSGQKLEAGIWKEELKQKIWRNATCWLPPHSMVNLLLYTTQDHVTRCNNTHSGQGPSTRTFYQDNTLQTCLQANIWRQLFFN